MLEKERKRTGNMICFNYDYGVQSGRECIGFTIEVFADYLRLDCVDWHKREVLYRQNRRMDRKG